MFEVHLSTFKVDATPPAGHPLCGGWIKPVEAVDDRLWLRGVVLTEAGPPIVLAALDWTGDPIEVANRFPSLGHGEGAYKGMLAHFEGYGDVVGDHPLNLASTQLATNAYMLTHEQKYKDWVLGYADAWAERAHANGGIIPSKVGLDGKIGGEEGKWYAGTYGWSFSPIVPMTSSCPS